MSTTSFSDDLASGEISIIFLRLEIHLLQKVRAQKIVDYACKKKWSEVCQNL